MNWDKMRLSIGLGTLDFFANSSLQEFLVWLSALFSHFLVIEALVGSECEYLRE